jgi:EAL domain-containing protein (putative c-di-GMP-specific phosphodiesterase class I)
LVRTTSRRGHSESCCASISKAGIAISSFDYIKEYRINHLKIAPSYIKELAIHSGDAAAMRAIVTFAHEMGIAVVAQGVENGKQRSLLEKADPDAQAQGIHFSKPVNPERAGELLRKGFLGEETSSRPAAATVSTGLD